MNSVLQALRRAGEHGSTIPDIVSTTGQTASHVRQFLTALMRQGSVAQSGEKFRAVPVK